MPENVGDILNMNIPVSVLNQFVDVNEIDETIQVEMLDGK